MPVKLSPRRERFCREYLKTGIAGEAARRAGYSQWGHPNHIYVQGHRLLRNDKVKTRLDQMIEEAAKTAVTGKEFTPEMILGRIFHIAMNGKQEGAQVRALELGGKFHKMWVERSETTVTDNAAALETLIAKLTAENPALGASMAQALGVKQDTDTEGHTLQ